MNENNSFKWFLTRNVPEIEEYLHSFTTFFASSNPSSTRERRLEEKLIKVHYVWNRKLKLYIFSISAGTEKAPVPPTFPNEVWDHQVKIWKANSQELILWPLADNLSPANIAVWRLEQDFQRELLVFWESCPIPAPQKGMRDALTSPQICVWDFTGTTQRAWGKRWVRLWLNPEKSKSRNYSCLENLTRGCKELLHPGYPETHRAKDACFLLARCGHTKETWPESSILSKRAAGGGW